MKSGHLQSSPSSSSSSAAALCLLVVLIVTTAGLQQVRAEIFTALVDLERVLEAEKSVADELRLYVEREQGRLRRLLRFTALVPTSSIFN